MTTVQRDAALPEQGTKVRTYTCVVCGAVGEQTGRGRPRKRCSDCKSNAERAREQARVYKPSVPCAVCGGLRFRGRGSLPDGKLTCQDCRRAKPKTKRGLPPQASRACESCSSEYQPVRRDQRWCSRKCKDRAYGAALRADGGPNLSPEARERQRAYWQEKNRRRRAQLRGAASEPYTTAEIAERDRFRCGLCGKRVPMDAKVPSPLAPTIDHVLPLHAGGDDTKANVQLAHFRCNNIKGPRGSQQLALIG